MKAVVQDFVQAEGTRTHINMLLRSVQHMGHSDALQVTDILHSLSVGYQYSIVDLVAANRPLLIPDRLPRLILAQCSQQRASRSSQREGVNEEATVS